MNGKRVPGTYMGVIAEYPAHFEWHKFLAPVVLPTKQNNYVIKAVEQLLPQCRSSVVIEYWNLSEFKDCYRIAVCDE